MKTYLILICLLLLRLTHQTLYKSFRPQSKKHRTHRSARFRELEDKPKLYSVKPTVVGKIWFSCCLLLVWGIREYLRIIKKFDYLLQGLFIFICCIQFKGLLGPFSIDKFQRIPFIINILKTNLNLTVNFIFKYEISKLPTYSLINNTYLPPQTIFPNLPLVTIHSNIAVSEILSYNKEIPSFENATQVGINNFESMFYQNIPDNVDMSPYNLFWYDSPTVTFNPMLL